MSYEPQKHTQPPIPKEIWGISLGNFFVNLSSVMVRSVFPIYLKNILGFGVGWIGTLEGLVEAMSFIMKMMAGVYSDYLRRRKFIIVLGYSLMLLSRPIFALFSSLQSIIIARLLDRFGNGIQASPRDALVGDFAPKEIRGACYGMRVGWATAGSFFATIVAFALMRYTNDDYQFVFLLSTIPGFIAVLIMTFCVKEKKINPLSQHAAPLEASSKPPRNPIHLNDIPRLGKNYWLVMVIVAIFMIAQLGEAILIFHAHDNFGLSAMCIPFVLSAFNATYSTVSYPAGRLSDRIGRHYTLMIGFLCLICGDLLLATAESLWVVFLGIAFCGAQMAITQSIFMTLITDNAPEDLRGTGFGIYYLICALCAVISNSGAGHISELYGQPTAFLISMAIASLALGLLFIIRPKKKTLPHMQSN